MNRRLLGLALLVSVGVNLGVLVMVLRRPPLPPADPIPVATTPVSPPPDVPPPPDPRPADPVIEAEPQRPPPDERRPPRPTPAPERNPEPVVEEPVRRPPEERPDRRPFDQPPLDQRPGVALRLERLADELGLTGETRDHFSRLQREFLRTAWHLRADLRNAEAEMRQELFSREPDRARIDEIQGRIETIRGELDSKLLDTVLQSRALLEPAQDIRYMAVVGRLRQAALGAPPRDTMQRPGAGAGDPRPFRRRPRNPRRPPG
ncbi:MAG: hypothetical protein SF066_02370 [Thermoanaerobaculia bacterium]|nr:hypothetical protein [Thermoanaerobaculia bacterium]